MASDSGGSFGHAGFDALFGHPRVELSKYWSDRSPRRDGGMEAGPDTWETGVSKHTPAGSELATKGTTSPASHLPLWNS